MPPATEKRRFEKSTLLISGWFASALYSVLTPDISVKRVPLRILMKPGISRGLAMSRHAAPIFTMNRQQQVSAKMW